MEIQTDLHKLFRMERLDIVSMDNTATPRIQGFFRRWQDFMHWEIGAETQQRILAPKSVQTTN